MCPYSDANQGPHILWLCAGCGPEIGLERGWHVHTSSQTTNSTMTLNPDLEVIRHYARVASSSSRVVMRKLAYPWTGSTGCSRPRYRSPQRAHRSPSTSSRGAGPAPWRSSRNEARRTWRHAGQERSGHGTRSCLLSQLSPRNPWCFHNAVYRPSQ